MTIQEIYHHYQIPPNLQTHMLQVAAVWEWICEHWQDKSLIDEAVIRQTLLLHDMGNIIKFDLDAGMSLMGEEAKNIDYWKEVQQEFRQKYGTDEHLATQTIAKELDMSDQVLRTMTDMGYSQMENCVRGSDYNAKICAYSDLRIAPHGLVSVQERLIDGVKRYSHRKGNLFKSDFEKNRLLCHELEEQIQDKLDIDIKLLTSVKINSISQKLLQTNLN